jgi:hypothetical protein
MGEIKRRKKIGVIFVEEESWAGGFYYVINILKSFNYLEDSLKPFLIIYILKPEYNKIIDQIGYPYFKTIPFYTFWDKGIDILKKISWRIFGKDYIEIQFKHKNNVEYILPANYYHDLPSLANFKRIRWIPDFQHLHLNHYFTSGIISFRNDKIKQIIANNEPIILSSFDAKNDFFKFFPEAKNQIYVCPFPSILPEITAEDVGKVRKKYNLNRDFIICSNQFWMHKNHLVVLKALVITQKKPFIVFTGNMDDHCERAYVEEILLFVKENKLETFVQFLGFIPRFEQLALIKASKIAIQPSLFEGWSTTVEDCKALNHPIIVSDLTVHKEQLGEFGINFEKENPASLSEVLDSLGDDLPYYNLDYKKNIVHFARQLIQIEVNDKTKNQ